MRCACIDIGSNTTGLLAADVDLAKRVLSPVSVERVFTRLAGRHHEEHGFSDRCADDVAAAVGQLSQDAEQSDVEQIAIVATGVTRLAGGQDLIDTVAKQTGREIRLLTPGLEARYAYYGATGARTEPDPGVCVIDSGGGSTELVTMPESDQFVTISVPIGSGLLARRFLNHDPPDQSELNSVRSYVESLIDGINFPHATSALLVGGGTIMAIGLLGGVIDPAGAKRAVEALVAEPAAEIATRYDITPERAHTAPAAMILLGIISERIGHTLEVGLGGLREGVVWELAGAIDKAA